MVKNLPCNVGDTDSTPGLGTKTPHVVEQLSPYTPEPMHHNKRPHMPQLSGEGTGTPLQYSCLENPMDRGAW